MGNGNSCQSTLCCRKNPNGDPSGIQLSKGDFKRHNAIGRGGFGKVIKVEKDGQFYAMKEMLKARVMAKKSVESVMKELELMAKINSNFIVNVQYAFHDKDYLYLVMDLMEGGDLRYHHAHIRKFKHNVTQFLIACLIQALEAVHEEGIIHRDIKPENLVFDSNGYLRLTDFGIARQWQPENSNESSGTPGYMAPEVMFKQNHGIAADYFAVGVIAYECMLGRRPYQGKSRKEIRDAIHSRQAYISKKDLPEGYSKEAADFINKCLMRQPSKRLGINGSQEVKEHPWFQDFDWFALKNKTMVPQFIPDTMRNNFDDNHVNVKVWDDQEEVKENEILLRRESKKIVFQDYYFDITKQVQPMRKNTLSSQEQLHQASSIHENIVSGYDAITQAQTTEDFIDLGQGEAYNSKFSYNNTNNQQPKQKY